MNGKRVLQLAAVVTALTITSIPARADEPCAILGPVGPVPVNGTVMGVLLETMENPPANAAPGGTGPLPSGTYPVGQGVRLAQATERGTLAKGCGTLAGLVGEIVVHAQSRVMVVADATGAPVINPVSGAPDLGVGPFDGRFAIKTDAGPVSGRIEGLLDFSQTASTSTVCNGWPCPFVWVQGSWTTVRNGAGGLIGVALVPFQNPAFDAIFGAGAWLYLDPTGTLPGIPIGQGVTVSPLDVGDFSTNFGTPLAKFLVILYQ